MATEKERLDLFLIELKELMKKHRCDIRADDKWQGFDECGRDIQIEVDFDIDYSEGSADIFDESFDGLIGDTIDRSN